VVQTLLAEVEGLVHKGHVLHGLVEKLVLLFESGLQLLLEQILVTFALEPNGRVNGC